MKSRKINKSRLTLAITAGTLGALAQQAVAAGFIEDSKASLTLRNFYINTDNRNGTASPSKQEEWGQGFILNYQSGFTQGTVGFGVDALGLLGVRLDGGGRAGKSGLDRQPGTVFPLESNGEPVHDFASLGLTAKAKVSNTEFRYGTRSPTTTAACCRSPSRAARSPRPTSRTSPWLPANWSTPRAVTPPTTAA